MMLNLDLKGLYGNYTVPRGQLAENWMIHHPRPEGLLKVEYQKKVC